MMGWLVLILLLTTGGITMASELTQDEQIKQFEDEIKLLQKKTELLTEQKKLSDKKAEIDSAELQDIIKALSELQLPEGNKGTITIAAGNDNAALLRSKRPMLELLDEVADTLVKECSEGAVLTTEERLKKAYISKFTSRLIDEEIAALDAFNRAMGRAPAGPPSKSVPAAVAIPLLGEALGLVEEVSKLFRVNRELTAFKEEEAEKLLKYLLDAKKESRIVTYPEELAGKAEKEAEALWEKRTKLSQELESAKTNLESLKKMQDADAAAIAALETNIKQAASLLEALDKSENLWVQVEGQIVASAIEGKNLLFLETQAQTVQIKESRWYASDRILAIGEVQVLYRLLNPDGSVKKTGIILKSSETDNMHLDKLEPINWSKP